MTKEMGNSQFPMIPDKRYHTIGEVSEWCGVEPHVLRYWETVFSQINPVRREGRRCYRTEDLEAVRTIYTLLRDEKYTIDGARKKMNEQDVLQKSYNKADMLDSIRQELEGILRLLK